MDLRMRAGSKLRHGQRGFTLLAVLFLLVLMALATQGVVFVLSQQAARMREEMLLRIGSEYVRAIKSYYDSSPGSVKTFPREISELVEDRRFVGIRRHIRQAYLDPITRTNWGVVRSPDGTIRGLYSRSLSAPIRSSQIAAGAVLLAPASRYADWKFVYEPAEPDIRQ